MLSSELGKRTEHFITTKRNIDRYIFLQSSRKTLHVIDFCSTALYCYLWDVSTAACYSVLDKFKATLIFIPFYCTINFI